MRPPARGTSLPDRPTLHQSRAMYPPAQGNPPLRYGLRHRPEGFERHEGAEPIWAEARGLDLLVEELRRYLTEQVKGRSYLIAGSRGSGKTTMVRRAYETVSGDRSLG